MAKQSRLLTEFYKSYLAWYDAGCPEGSYSKGDGLCIALAHFAEKNGIDGNKFSVADREMHKQFMGAGLSGGFPFEGIREYFASDDLTTNPKRIAWVREHARGE